jgi:hypothetical protein
MEDEVKMKEKEMEDEVKMKENGIWIMQKELRELAI